MADCSIRRLIEKSYPNLFNEYLPNIVSCPAVDDTDTALKSFKRYLFKNAIISRIESVHRNQQRVCGWRVYYQLRGENDQEGNAVPAKLPVHGALEVFFHDITRYRPQGMEVFAKSVEDSYSAIVDYVFTECECEVKDLELATEIAQMWPAQ